MTIRKRPKQELWLLSFSDIMTNLLGFMILLLSFSKIDQNRFDSISKEMTRKRSDSLDELQKKLQKEIQAKQLEEEVKVSLDLSGLNIEFLGSVLFQTGGADLNQQSKTEAKPILKLISNLDPKYKISFEGHTDDLPLSGGLFQNNWILSSARGVSLLLYMQELGANPKNMSISGYSDTKPKQAIENLSGAELEKARALNRRVIVRIYQ